MAQDFLIDPQQTDTTIVPAPGANQFIRVISYHLTCPNTGRSATWKSNTTVKCIDYVGDVMSVDSGDDDYGVFDCDPGQALVLTVSGAMGGCGKYTIMGK